MESLENYLENLLSCKEEAVDKQENSVKPEISAENEQKSLNNQEKKPTVINTLKIENEGYLYVVADEINQVCKIGISKNPQKRLKALQTGYPTELKIIFSVFLKNPRKIEQMVHEALDDFRLNGEWFYIDAYYLVDWSSLKDFKIA